MKTKNLIISIVAMIVLGFGVACDPPEGEEQQVPPPAPEAPSGYEQPSTPGEEPGTSDPGDQGQEGSTY
ncbi:MAG: hypothetical protein ACLFP9_03440 [Desulfonatronovibrio sp.]